MNTPGYSYQLEYEPSQYPSYKIVLRDGEFVEACFEFLVEELFSLEEVFEFIKNSFKREEIPKGAIIVQINIEGGKESIKGEAEESLPQEAEKPLEQLNFPSFDEFLNFGEKSLGKVLDLENLKKKGIHFLVIRIEAGKSYAAQALGKRVREHVEKITNPSFTKQ